MSKIWFVDIRHKVPADLLEIDKVKTTNYTEKKFDGIFLKISVR
jgi:hypothetical protein